MERRDEDTCVSAAAPVLRETIQIVIDGEIVTVYKDELEKALYGNLAQVLDCGA